MTYRTRIKYTAKHDGMDAGGRTNQETESRKMRCGIGGNVVNPLKPLGEYLIGLHPQFGAEEGHNPKEIR